MAWAFNLTVHHDAMLYIGEPEIPGGDDHEGFVAGRYRDGAYSDIWTDVRRCADRTFLAYAPACECGWRGPDQAATALGYDTCRRTWVTEHFAAFARTNAERLRGQDFLST